MLTSVVGFILFLVCSFISLALKITNKDLNCSSDQKKRVTYLITDPASIRFHTANHFQNIVGHSTSDGSIPEEWQQDYLPLESIDDSIYASLDRKSVV